MTRQFDCPGCGAALDPSGGQAIVVCAYCGRRVLVPPDLRPAPPPIPPDPIAPLRVVLTPATTPPTSPAPGTRRSNRGCAGCALLLLLALVAVPAALGAAEWSGLWQAAQDLLPTGFAKLVLTFGEKGDALGQMHNPTDLAVDGAGNVYVLDRDPGA